MLYANTSRIRFENLVAEAVAILIKAGTDATSSIDNYAQCFREEAAADIG
jgi:hypothetical protein